MCFVAVPTPLVPWVGIAPPIHKLRREETRRGGTADHRERTRPAAGFRRRLGKRRRNAVRRSVLRRSTLGARPDEAWLELAQKDRILREWLRELSGHASAARRPLREATESVGAAINQAVAAHYRLTGGSSPVATRQMPVAARRAAMVAKAPRPVYKPVHITLRSMPLLPYSTSGLWRVNGRSRESVTRATVGADAERQRPAKADAALPLGRVRRQRGSGRAARGDDDRLARLALARPAAGRDIGRTRAGAARAAADGRVLRGVRVARRSGRRRRALR